MPVFHVYDYPSARALNVQVRNTFDRHLNSHGLQRTHYFHGRFENLYLPLEHIPEIRPLLTFVKQTAQSILQQPGRNLRVGYWFNHMQPGQMTTRHTHDEDDELLSAVYYVSVPSASGDLILYPPGRTVRIVPREGQLIMFPPDLPHAVGENLSAHPRLSIGMNLGPD